MRHRNDPSRRPRRAAVLIDYDNLYRTLADRVDRSRYTDDLISELVDELRRHLTGARRTRPVITQAFGDFSAFDGDGPYIQRALSLEDVEPRFVPSTLQANAAEIQLCVEAMELLHGRPDVDTFVLLTGDGAYLPLVQRLRQYGRSVVVAAVEPASLPDALTSAADAGFLDALELLADEPRRGVRSRPRRSRNEPAADAPSVEKASAKSASPVFTEIEDPFVRLALQIIEEHFGQYEEVYLTPLLRKLSELLDEQEHDPKELVGHLERCGAVRLEKRRGFPHDYTVLIVEPDHPDVRSIQHARFDGARQEQEADDASPYGVAAGLRGGGSGASAAGRSAPSAG